MKNNKLTEYKEMTVENLNVELRELKKELFKLRFQHAMNGLDNPNRIKDVKRNISRINTIISEKNMNENN
ncbi:MAG: 50S ribosomal protein L29 [Clostridia bacterium]